MNLEIRRNSVAALVGDPQRWAAYVRDALIETTSSKDVLLMAPVQKPALLRRVFDLACRYSGQELSYQKTLGHLSNAGSTTSIAHYLQLLEGAGMVCGLQKYAGQAVRQRGSSPKQQVFNTALMGLLPQQKALIFSTYMKRPNFGAASPRMRWVLSFWLAIWSTAARSL